MNPEILKTNPVDKSKLEAFKNKLAFGHLPKGEGSNVLVAAAGPKATEGLKKIEKSDSKVPQSVTETENKSKILDLPTELPKTNLFSIINTTLKIVPKEKSVKYGFDLENILNNER